MDRRGTSSRRARRDSGASAVEYGLIIAGAGVVLVALSFATGKAVSGAFLANATAVGGASGSVGAAQLGGVVANPSSSSVAPTTTSAAPTTTSAAPTTTSAAPVTTSAAPTTTSASPTATVSQPPVQPSGTTAAPRGSATTVDVGGNGGSKNQLATVSPSSAGTVSWASNGDLIFTPAANATQYGLVTVTYTFTNGGNRTNGTVTFWIT